MDKAETFQAVLSDPRIVAIDDIMAHHEENADIAQKTFRQFAAVFIGATALASLAAALILYGSGSNENDNMLAQPGLRNVLLVVEVAALAIAAFAAHIQETRQHSARWGRERQQAEACRIERFETVLATAATHGGETLKDAFDHFLSGQLDEQLSYFDKSALRHDNRSSRLAIAGAVVAAVVAVAGISGLSEGWLPLAALAGVVAPIFLTALNSWRDTGSDQDKAARYSDVWMQLRRLKGQSDIVRAKLAAGDTEAMHTFVTQVHDILKAENETWSPTGEVQP